MLTPERASYYAAEFDKLAPFEQSGDGAVAVREAGRLFEELLRDVIRDVISKVDFVVRRAIFESEAEIGKGQRGVAEFMLGELVRLWRSAKLLSALEKVEGRPTRALEGIRLEAVCDLRNDCVHNGYQPERHEVVFAKSALRAFLEYCGVRLGESTAAIRSISDVQSILSERFSSVEVIEGTVAFYRRLAETVSRPEIDTFDLTFLVNSPPREVKYQSVRDPTREYFDTVRRRILAREARLRRIVTFNNPAKTAWILFDLIGSHSDVFDDTMTLATFSAARGNGAANVMIPNLAMYYSSFDLSDGVAWVYSHQEDDQQNFIGFSGKSLLPTMRRLYLNWFNSCDRITEERAVAIFRSLLGTPTDEDGVRAIAERYRASILLDEEGLEKSVEYWTRLLRKYLPQPSAPGEIGSGKWDSAAWMRLGTRPSSG